MLVGRCRASKALVRDEREAHAGGVETESTGGGE